MRIFFIVISLILFIPNAFFYEGQKLNLCLFYFSSCFYVFYSTREKFIFTEVYLSILLWLGFVFKFSFVNLDLSMLKESKAFLELKPVLMDEVLMISSAGFFLLIVLSFLREKIIFNYKSHNFSKTEKFTKYYFKNERLILFLFFLIIIIFSALNFKYGIYQKGIILNGDINPLFAAIFKWLTMFGFASISSFIIFSYLKKKKSFFKSISIGLLESMITSYSFLSRSLIIFTTSSFIIGFLKFKQLNDVKKINTKLFLNYFLIIIILVLSILYFVESKRKNLLYNEKSNDTKISKDIINEDKFIFKGKNIEEIIEYYFKNEYINDIGHLILYRWVGLDSMVTVVHKKDLSLDIFFNSFNEQFNNKEYSYYEKIFLNKNNTFQGKTENNYGIIVPGFFSYSFYSGSLLIFLILISIFYFIGLFFESISFKFTYGNYIFSALISQVYVYRLMHFGYMPQNSWKLIFAILLNISMYYFICYLFNRFKK